MRDLLCPGDGPYASSGLIIHACGMILAVSRKHDPTDMGLPGGKVDPGQNFLDACVAEVAQETGLTVTKAEPFFGDYCGNPTLHKVHWNLTFLCKVQGTIHTQEKGRVAWVHPSRVMMRQNFTRSSFWDYNLRLLNELLSLQINVQPWMNTIPLDHTLVDLF